ncbi:hypothetical protein D3H54_04180 [Mycobacterium sp. ELW1]|nr:hypothetical protein D3H54_04180 [Mycobacterium sp. ELW1]
MIARLLSWVKPALPRREPDVVDTTRRKVLRWSKCAVWILIGLVTLQSLLLVAGAWRNDRQIERNMGVAQAEVLSAGPRRSTIEFVTPDRVTYRPELGVLYPSELAEGMRIYVEYDRNDPDLVRVQHRTAALAIIPAGSIAVVAWLIGGLVLTGLVLLERRVNQVDISLDNQLLS